MADDSHSKSLPATDETTIRAALPNVDVEMTRSERDGAEVVTLRIAAAPSFEGALGLFPPAIMGALASNSAPASALGDPFRIAAPPDGFSPMDPFGVAAFWRGWMDAAMAPWTAFAPPRRGE